MADDKTKRSAQDRDRVSAGDSYEVDYFAKKHGLTRDQVLALIKEHGNDRATLDLAAAKLKTI